jgi:nitrogen fixation/metabolism regulation signal transduction histidine kinase
MTEDMRNRRKTLVINKPVQKRIVMGITVVPIVTLIAATLAVAVLTGRVLDEARSAEETLPTLGPLFVSLFLFIVAAGAVVVLQALRYSHKIAGPMYRLIKSLERMRTGDVSFRVKLRQGDELGELADEVNRVIEWVQAHQPAGIHLITDPEEAARLREQTPPSSGQPATDQKLQPSVDDIVAERRDEAQLRSR